jgi:hypothetical protein
MPMGAESKWKPEALLELTTATTRVGHDGDGHRQH